MGEGFRKDEQGAGDVDGLLAHEGQVKNPADRVEWVGEQNGGGEGDVNEDDGEAEGLRIQRGREVSAAKAREVREE
jgi:hypothetical protein